jgi:Neprosin
MVDQDIDRTLTNPEVRLWLGQRQQALRIAATTTTPDGQTLDWVPGDSQLTGGIATPPPAAGTGSEPDQTRGSGDPERPTASVQFDTGEPGPAGHVPILRPHLGQVESLEGLRRLQAKRGGLRVNVHRGNKKPTDPSPAGYFHAMSSQSATVYGTDGRLNLWDPIVDIPSSPGDDHSISQLWLQNYQTPQVHSVEGGLTVDHSLNGDGFNYLFTYYTSNGYAKDGDNSGGYNRLEKGWVQYDSSIFPGIRINGASAQGGSTQLEIGIKFQLYAGNWWFGFSTDESAPWTWLGYYPGTLFAGGLVNSAQWVGWGGEVYSALADPCSTTDQMGSGRHAGDGWSYACYQRLIRNQSDSNGTLENFSGTAQVDVAASGCPNDEYTIEASMNSGSAWGSYQYFGGPAA